MEISIGHNCLETIRPGNFLQSPFFTPHSKDIIIENSTEKIMKILLTAMIILSSNVYSQDYFSSDIVELENTLTQSQCIEHISEVSDCSLSTSVGITAEHSAEVTVKQNNGEALTLPLSAISTNYEEYVQNTQSKNDVADSLKTVGYMALTFVTLGVNTVVEDYQFCSTAKEMLEEQLVVISNRLPKCSEID